MIYPNTNRFLVLDARKGLNRPRIETPNSQVYLICRIKCRLVAKPLRCCYIGPFCFLKGLLIPSNTSSILHSYCSTSTMDSTSFDNQDRADDREQMMSLLSAASSMKTEDTGSKKEGGKKKVELEEDVPMTFPQRVSLLFVVCVCCLHSLSLLMSLLMSVSRSMSFKTKQCNKTSKANSFLLVSGICRRPSTD